MRTLSGALDGPSCREGRSGYLSSMDVVSIEDAQDRLTELARRVERGETIVVTRDGEPVLDLVPHRRISGLDLEAGGAYLRAHGITNPIPTISDDFDDPLPEDILLRPLA